MDMVLIARRKEKLKEIKSDLESKHGVSVYIIAKDLTDDTAVEEIFEELKENNITVEYLINNAWFGGVGKFHEREIWADVSMIELNILAVVKLTRKFIPEMLKNGKGKILNVSSTAGLLPWPNQATYFASKAFVSSWSYAIAEELSDTPVTVTALLPGATDTEFWSVSGMDKTSLFQNTASAQEVAQQWYDAMMQGKLSIIAGVWLLWKILIYLIPFIPKKLLLQQIEKAQKV